MNILVLQFLLEIYFLTIVFLHITKKNSAAIVAYSAQSFIIVLILFNSYLKTGDLFLLVITTLVFIIKVVFAPMFFTQLINRHKLTFSSNTYLNTPITLITIVALTLLANSEKFTPLTNINPINHPLLSLALSAMFLSLFLIINRKGALSQIIGILSFENCIVIFSTFAGLEQSSALEFGIIFDIFIWVIIATVFVSMIYKHFKSLDLTYMKHLKD